MIDLLIRRREMGLPPTPPLPYDAEVEYLESTGTQRIDTGIMYDSSVVVETKVYVLTSDTGKSVFGIYWDGGGGAQRWNFQAVTSSPYGNAQMGTKQKPYALPKNTWVTLHADYRYITSNGTSYDSGASAFNPTDDVEIPIFARHLVYTQNTHDSYINMRLESFQITKGGVLVRDFVPVRVGQVGYLYDEVSGQLFGNAGTGSFLYGNDVFNS